MIIMATMVIEYDERNKTVEQMLNGLLLSGVIRRPKAVRDKNKQLAEFKQALHEAKAMAADIAVNGTRGYESMDDVLKTL
jgi:hypothetical protein